MITSLTIVAAITLFPGQIPNRSTPPIMVMDTLWPPVTDSRVKRTVQGRPVSEVRIENARTAEKLILRYGFGDIRARLAMLANAFDESGWNATTIYREGNGTTSRGFFQLTNGDLTIEGNVAQLITKAPYKRRVEEWYKWLRSDEKITAGEAAHRFARKVEICAQFRGTKRSKNRVDVWVLRQKYADSWMSELKSRLAVIGS